VYFIGNICAESGHEIRAEICKVENSALNLQIWHLIGVDVCVDILVIYDGYGGLLCGLQFAAEIHLQVGLIVQYIEFTVLNLEDILMITNPYLVIVHHTSFMLRNTAKHPFIDILQ